MKNLIIAILSTIIFYTQFCEVKIPAVMPILALMIWVSLIQIDEWVAEYRQAVRRGQKLQDTIKKVRRSA